MRTRSLTPILLLSLCTAVGVACGPDRHFEFEPTPTPVFNTLNVTPTGATIAQGSFGAVAATLTRSSGKTGAVNLTVTGLPAGVEAIVSNVQTTGLVTHATIEFSVNLAATPNTYGLVVHGTETGVAEATVTFALTVEPEVIAPCPAVTLCAQWAADATASSEYTTTAWSARQATGKPDAAPCEDDGRAWASLESNRVEWLELTFNESVRPSEIRIHEVLGVSSLVKVEVRDGGGVYYPVFSAQPLVRSCPRILSIPVTGISATVRVVRLTFDQGTLNDWNEVDAVRLIGRQ
jgi:hypothetical protein